MTNGERLEQIEARVNEVPGQWQACNMVDEDGRPMTPGTIGAYVEANIRQSIADGGSEDRFLFISVDTPDGPKDVCHVGNGARGPFNADFIANAPDDVRWLIARVRELEQTVENLKDAL